MAGYTPRWLSRFTRPQTVTNPGTNRARRSATTLIETTKPNGHKLHAYEHTGNSSADLTGKYFAQYICINCVKGHDPRKSGVYGGKVSSRTVTLNAFPAGPDGAPVELRRHVSPRIV